MKLLPEHGQNITPYLRQGVYFLILGGDVVYFSDSDNIFRDIVEYQEKDIYPPFDAFSYIICGQEEAAWLSKQMEEIYFKKNYYEYPH